MKVEVGVWMEVSGHATRICKPVEAGPSDTLEGIWMMAGIVKEKEESNWPDSELNLIGLEIYVDDMEDRPKGPEGVE